MPTAICNTCQELIHWRNQRGIFLKDQRCKCGSAELKAVFGTYNEDTNSWDYYDRRGNYVVNVPRESKLINEKA